MRERLLGSKRGSNRTLVGYRQAALASDIQHLLLADLTLALDPHGSEFLL